MMPRGIEAINKPTKPEIKPANPNPSVFRVVLLVYVGELIWFGIGVSEGPKRSRVQFEYKIPETSYFGMEISGPVRLLHFLYLISLCPISSTYL